MPRRILIEQVHIGEIVLDDRQRHHLRNVLRLQAGTVVEVFDKTGTVGHGILQQVSESRVIICVQSVAEKSQWQTMHLTLASAIPKAARADWLIEKCSELDVDVFIPLQTQRSVTEPGGKNKFERWQRIAQEASKQSHRAGVMEIRPLVSLQKATEELQSRTPIQSGIFLSTQPECPSLIQLSDELIQKHATHLTAFIGPEGGWTDEEIASMQAAGLLGARLTDTVLRIETAGLATAAIIKSMRIG